MEFEKRGIPAVTFVTEWFLSLAETTKRGAGLPDLNVLTVPHPLDDLSEGELIATADKVFDQVIDAVTTRAFARVQLR